MTQEVQKTTKSDLTKKRILSAARKLFNEHGTLNISTNRIADETGISPGNLYYHFRDKEEIIRAIFAEYSSANQNLWHFGKEDTEGNIDKFLGNLLASMDLAWEYRFFEREILGLLQSDPKLKSTYREAYEYRLSQWIAFGEALASQGILRTPNSPGTLKNISTALWLIGQSWIPFLDITGNPTNRREVARGVTVVLAVLEPYLTDRGRKIIEHARKQGELRSQEVAKV